MESNGTFKSYEPLEKIITEINLIVPKVYLARCSRLAYRAKQVFLAMKLDILLLSNPGMQVKMLLLFTCLEDVKTHLMRFIAIDQKLAARIAKAGTDQEEFVKLTERLQHCIFELQISVRANLFDDLEDDEDFRADFTILRAELENYLSLMKSDPNENFASIKTKMDKVLQKTKELIVGQKLMKASYKSKRAAGADITIDGKELNFLRVIGQGGFATVWAGQYKNEVVAIKKIDPSTCCSFDEFKREANIMRRVSHPRTVACYGVAEIEGSFCMVMEYLEHDSVFIWLAKSKYAQSHGRTDIKLPDWSTKQEIILDIAYGMAYLHRLRIIHRDLKSPNVLLDNSYRAKVADFGLSVVKSNTSTNVKMDEAGTANYMAPECFGLNAIYSTRSDVFAFSILLWEIVEWEFPFQGMDRYAIKNLVVKDKFRLPLSPNLPVCFSSLITATWAQKPENRPNFKKICEFVENINFHEGFINISEVFPQVADDMSQRPAPKCTNPDLEKFWKKLTSNNSQPTWDQFFKLVASYCGVEIASIDTARLRKKLDPSSTMKMPSYANIILVIQDGDLKKFFSRFLLSNIQKSSSAHKGSRSGSNVIAVAKGKSAQSESPRGKNKPEAAEISGESDKPWTKKQLIILASICIVLLILLSVIIALTVESTSNQNTSTNSAAAFSIDNMTIPVDKTQSSISTCTSPNLEFSIFAGQSGSSTFEDGSLGTTKFSEPIAIAAISANNFYVSDNSRIRQVNSSGAFTIRTHSAKIESITTVGSKVYYGHSTSDRAFVTVLDADKPFATSTTFAGGLVGFQDGNPGKLGSIKSIFYDTDGDRILVSDSQNNLIRAINSDGSLQTVYGKKKDFDTGGSSDGYSDSAEFFRPDGIAKDSKGNLYIADTGNHLIRRIGRDGYVSTFAGIAGISTSVDGNLGTGTLSEPSGLYIDKCDNIFITEFKTGKLRMLSSNGILTTVARVSVMGARSLTSDSTGAIFVADTRNTIIQKIAFV